MNKQRDNNDDDPRDAHLLAALRHAPDRDARPPREVSERILAAARAAVRPAPWWTRLGAWLTQPQVAASFGTLAVATLVGVMWSTREPSLPEPTSAPSMQDDSAAAAARSAASAPSAEAPPAAAVDVLRESPVEAPRKPQLDALKRDDAPRPAPALRQAPPAGTPAAKAAARGEPAASAEALVRDGAKPSTTAPAPSPPSAPAANAAPAPALDLRARELAQAAAGSRAEASAPALDASSQKATVGRVIAIDPLLRLDPVLAAGGAVWSIGGRAVPHGAAQAAWWQQLRRAAVGVWLLEPAGQAPGAPAPRLTLLSAGKSVASFELAGDAVLLCPVDLSGCWRAPITPAQREAWTAEIARW
jgi:hypothetical protein